MSLPAKILIREVGPREGFQTLDHMVPLKQKLELISALEKTGVAEIEVTSFVRADRVPQMADASKVVAGLPARSSVSFKALYLNMKGFELAEQFGTLQNEGWVYLSASETFLRKNSNTTISDSLKRLPDWIALFSKYKKSFYGAMISAAFGCNYEGPIEEKKVLQLVNEIVSVSTDAGQAPQEISLADTMGRGNPEQVKRIVAAIKERHPEIVVSLHLHDTRGTGMANAYAGLEEGVTIFESSVGGLGGCPFAKGAAGNICTEDLAYMCAEIGVETGLDLQKYIAAAQLAESLAGKTLPGKLYKTFQDGA